MKQKLSPALLCIVSVMALILVCFMVMPGESISEDPHAGHNHAAGETHADTVHTTSTTLTPHNKPAKECYRIAENKDGTYSYEISMRNGSKVTSKETYVTKPTITVMNDDVLMVSHENKQNNLSREVIYYHVGRGIYSQTYTAVLNASLDAVAYLYGDMGQFSVVVCDPFASERANRIELGRLTITPSGNPEITYALQKDNVLKVTCTVDGVQKEILVDVQSKW